MYNRKTIRDNLITCQQVTVTNYGFWLFCLWDSENEQKRVHVVDSESEWKRMRVVDRKPVEKNSFKANDVRFKFAFKARIWPVELNFQM